MTRPQRPALARRIVAWALILVAVGFLLSCLAAESSGQVVGGLSGAALALIGARAASLDARRRG